MSWRKILLGIALGIGGLWAIRYLATPPPGTAVADQGRQHVSAQEVAQTSYNSNPPTSGPHVVTWVKAGIYTEPQTEGELLHALEHGYVNIQYNCNAGQAVPEASASATNESERCAALVKQLDDLATAKRLWKLIVVPRPTLDTAIALTAWNRLEKMNDFDASRIGAFIDYWRDHGPEQTME